MSDFDQFWAEFPRRTAKLAAMKAFVKARKIASLEDILAGVRRYVEYKPEYADFCHPATWLNQGRWLDEPDRRHGDRRHQDRRAPERDYEWPCPHGGVCGSQTNCRTRQILEQARAARG